MSNVTNRFAYRREAGQNPYSGFMSFQHFRGDPLYSDIVVRPEAHGTETERVECYPVSPDAEEMGRAEGYYPDTSVVYIRALWKEFEPERHVYNYAFIRDILDKAKAHKQSLIFRLMPHSTRASDDVPDWLKAIMPCPERPEGKRVKDSPTDPRYMEYFQEAIRALGREFDSDPTFEAIDVSLTGAWGEGSRFEQYPKELPTQIMDTYLDAFPNTQLITQVCRPELIHHAAPRAKVGWRGDGLGQPDHIRSIYPPNIEQVPDNWKIAPVSFESFWWLCEWERQGWDIDAIIQVTLDWHLSSVNAKSMPIPEKWRDKIDAWVAKMGYHFAIDAFTHPESAAAGEEIPLTLEIENVGVAPIYKKLPLVLAIGPQRIVTDIDIRSWLPGRHTEHFTLRLPALPAGEHPITVTIENDLPVYFATDAERDGTSYRIGRIRVK